MELKSIILHLYTSRLLKCKHMAGGGQRHKPSYQRELSQLQPCHQGVDREKEWSTLPSPSLHHSLLLNHQQWGSHQIQEQTNSTFMILLTHAFSSSPKQRALPCLGALGEAGGCPSCPNAHTALSSDAQKAFGKYRLAPSCFLSSATLRIAPSQILPPLLLLKPLQHVALTLCTAACEFFQSQGFNGSSIETKGTFITVERRQGFSKSENFLQ